MATELFEAVQVNVTTGVVTYPAVEGFKLDMEAVYRVVALFLPHCGGNLELATRHAVYGQLTAFTGAATLRKAVA